VKSEKEESKKENKKKRGPGSDMARHSTPWQHLNPAESAGYANTAASSLDCPPEELSLSGGVSGQLRNNIISRPVNRGLNVVESREILY